jgi:hypothetical protein
LKKLNLPVYSFRIRKLNEKEQIFDEIRKRFVALTPEEWVRQNFIKYLRTEKQYPASLISIERGLKLYKRRKRTDAVIFNNYGKPLLIVECKAPEVMIDQEVFDQIVRYNMALNVKYLVLTNGIFHYSCIIDYDLHTYNFLKEIPTYQDLK